MIFFMISRYPFRKGWTPLSGAIKLAQSEKWHHCGMVMDGMVYESVGKGFIQTQSFEDLKSGAGKYYDLIYKEVNGDRATLIDLIGTPYDYFGLVYQLDQQITGKWRGGKRTKKMVCSGTCAKILGYKEYWKIDPQDLYRDEMDSVINR